MTVAGWGGNPTNKEVIWSSSNEEVATVDANGKVTAVGAGVATITATSKGLGVNMEQPASSSCVVSVQGVEGEYIYRLQADGSLQIVKYTGAGGAIVVPSTIQGKPVTDINTYKFGDDTVTSIVIPEGVTRIGKEAFNFCKNLKSVKLPSTLTTIADSAFRKSGLPEIVLPDHITSVGLNAFQDIPVIKAKNNTTTAKTLKAAGLAFVDSVIYPEVIQIGPTTKTLDQGKSVQLKVTSYSGNSTNHDVTWSTSDAKIATVDDKGNVTAIGPGEVTITATALGNAPNAEKPATASMTITVRGVEGNYIYTVKNGEAEINQYTGKEADVLIPSTLGNYKVTALGPNSLWMNKDMKTVVIPEGVKKIGKYSFNGCSNITKIDLPSTIRTLEERAFYGTAIREMIVPEGVTSLGNEVFSNCKQLMSLTLPSTLTRFGHNMFSHCDSLMALYLPDNITGLGTNTFAGVAGTLYVHKDSKTEATLKKANVNYQYYFDLGSINQVPTIEAKDLVLVEGDVFDPLQGVKATDPEDGDIVLTKDNILKNTVDTTKYGDYEVTYFVADQGGATIQKTIRVKVLPKMQAINQAPVIQASDRTILEGDSFDPLKDVQASDAEDGTLVLSEKNVLKNTVDPFKSGTYEVIYQVMDSNGAMTTKTIQVNVLPKQALINQAPTIQAKDQTIVIGSEFDPFENVTAMDAEDGDLTSQLSCTSNVDRNQLGTYEVTYTVMDSQGAATSKTIQVNVVEKEEKPNDKKKPEYGTPTNTSTQTNVKLFSVVSIASFLAGIRAFLKNKNKE